MSYNQQRRKSKAPTRPRNRVKRQQIKLKQKSSNEDLKCYFKEKLGRKPTEEELKKINLYLSNEERDPSDKYVRQDAVDRLIKQWNIQHVK